MSEQPAKRWRLRFTLRHLFVAIGVAALLTAFFVHGWRRAQMRREFVDQAGAVAGHPRTMQGYRGSVLRFNVAGMLFDEKNYDAIWLYPGTYDAEYLARLHTLFPEAEVTDYDDS